VYALYSMFASESEKAEMAGRYRAGGLGYGDVKKALLDHVEAFFAPFRKRREELLADPGHVESVLQRGAERARAEADRTLSTARRACGID
jgi:tryptophanyl-tRNA synthetase